MLRLSRLSVRFAGRTVVDDLDLTVGQDALAALNPLATVGRHLGIPLRRHLLPAVAGPVTRHALARVPATALTVAGLGFLGLGAGHDSPEWGAQLAAAVTYLERAPLAVLGPVAGLGLLGLLAAATPGRPSGVQSVSRSG